MSGFRKFLMRGNIIDLAVAVVMGVAFNAIVQAQRPRPPAIPFGQRNFLRLLIASAKMKRSFTL